ncbi:MULTISPECIES: hypothetical protein [Pseudomonadati]|uniref:Lipoprotein n=1 Tax=Shewanella aestuarii TaxID=1028752 RepID=A0ABT0L301_9GAMM|nr:hypothetical protein [Shewanella aestuarii]MCL1117880.1 hypothetical protein [Shewanella aestuarii]GGN78725.1 hypothetical protein GCM10009193_22070 [Shewanella aestuarii]
MENIAKSLMIVAILAAVSGCSTVVCDARTDTYTNDLDKNLSKQECVKQVDDSINAHFDKQEKAEREASDKLLRDSLNKALAPKTQ